MAKWPKDTQAARNAFYGDPGKGEIGPQMVPVVPPFAMYYGGKRVKSIQFHRKAAPALLAAFNEIWDACDRDQAKIDAAGVSNYNGAYNHRLVRGSATKWSNHAYGTAIDLNAGENGLGVKVGRMPQFVIDAFCRQGAMWGGWYKSRPDWMHFEFVDNGGRKPSGPAPAFVQPAAFMSAPDAPPDEFETEAAEPVETAADDEAADPPKTVEPSPLAAIVRQAGGVVIPGGAITGREVNKAVNDAATVAIQNNHGKLDLSDIGVQLLTNGWFWLGMVVLAVGGYALWVRFGERKAKAV